MRWTFILFLWGLPSGSLHAAPPPPLGAAVQSVFEHYDRWAYTQTTIETDAKGKVKSTRVVRFDPSRPYAEHYTPLSLDGRPPTERQLKRYRKWGEQRGDQAARAEAEGVPAAQQTLGELMDLDLATQVEASATETVFEVPLKKEGNRRLPPEKFRVLARVDNETRTFVSIHVELREPMRAKVVAKIKTAAGELTFGSVDPQFPPTLTKLAGGGTGSVMLVPVGRTYVVTRTDFKRVKPYAERFHVDYGPLKSLDF